MASQTPAVVMDKYVASLSSAFATLGDILTLGIAQRHWILETWWVQCIVAATRLYRGALLELEADLIDQDSPATTHPLGSSLLQLPTSLDPEENLQLRVSHRSWAVVVVGQLQTCL